MKRNVLALQKLTSSMRPDGGSGGGPGGSTLTVLGCGSQSPSNLSVLTCH